MTSNGSDGKKPDNRNKQIADLPQGKPFKLARLHELRGSRIDISDTTAHLRQHQAREPRPTAPSPEVVE